MPDQSISTPPALASAGFQELADKLYSVGAVVDDCKWVVDALCRSATSTRGSTPHEAQERMQGVSRTLFAILREASTDIFDLAEALENKNESIEPRSQPD